MTVPPTQKIQQGHTLTEIPANPGPPAHIYLSDIQSIFPSASRFLCESKTLDFLTDSNGTRLFPLRLPAQLTSIIHVVPEHDSPIITRPPRHKDRVRACNSPTSPGIDTPRSHQVPTPSVSTLPLSSTPTATPISSPTSMSATSRRHLSRSTSAPDDVRLSQLYHHSLSIFEDFQKSIQLGQIDRAEGFLMDFSLKLEAIDILQDISIASGNSELSHRMTHLQGQMHATLEQSKAGRLSPELTRTLSLSGCSLPPSTFEMQEWETSRLFIVLPELHDYRLGSTLYRLHFLCECRATVENVCHATSPVSCERNRSSKQSIHSLTESISSNCSSSSSSNMRPHRQPHLSRHEGYAIDRPTEFFHQYGDYMLGVLETYKVDIITNRPPDMSSTGVHEMTGKNAPSDASPPITNIESRVQQAIEFLQGKSQANLGHGGSYKPRAVDMEQVGSFINGHLTDKTLAQLCKVQTSDGTVDWVCWEHFRRQYGPRQLSNFWRVLKRSQDILEEHLGGLVMTLNTSAEAVQLYKAMEEAPGLVQELKLTLKWEVPVADMLALRDAVYRANVRHLTLSYTPSKAKSEFMNKKKRSGPLWDMIGNKKLRSFTLDGKTGLLSKMAHEIQPFSLVSLRISECVNWKKHSARILDIIKMGVNLTELRMGCLEIEEPYHAILKTLQKQNNNVMPSNSIMSNKDSNTNSSNSSLRILALTTSPTDNVTLQLSSASPIAMSLTISSLDNTILERTTVLRSLHIRPKMNSALVGVRDRVEAIVSRNPELAKLNIQCQLSEFIELFQIMRTIALGSRNQVKALTLYRDRNKLYTTNIRNDGATSLELLSLNEPKEVLEALFEQYGSRLTKLRCNTPRYVPDSLFELLLLATRFTGSRLTELTLDIRSVGVSALEDLQRVVLRSQELKVLQIDLTMAFDLVAGGEWVQFITSVESKLTQIRVVKAFVDRWRMALQRSAVLAAEMILLMEDHIPFRRQIKDADMAMIARNCAAY